LIKINTHLTVADAIRTIKANSSKWIHATYPEKATFAWQGGYGAFSVSQSNIKRVCDYIEHQEKHHQKISFQNELKALLEKHNLTLYE